MGFLRRLLGGDDRGKAASSESERSAEAPSGVGAGRAPLPQAALDEEERARELELARFEQARTDDLVRRQQRYADRSWTPPAQGGSLRADDEDVAAES
jgi:hypothetical protein